MAQIYRKLNMVSDLKNILKQVVYNEPSFNYIQKVQWGIFKLSNKVSLKKYTFECTNVFN
jgi:hypothetical protein